MRPRAAAPPAAARAPWPPLSASCARRACCLATAAPPASRQRPGQVAAAAATPQAAGATPGPTSSAAPEAAAAGPASAAPAAPPVFTSCRLEPLGRTFEFPHRGSGLLWARSTGLKLWPGAVLLARCMCETASGNLAPPQPSPAAAADAAKAAAAAALAAAAGASAAGPNSGDAGGGALLAELHPRLKGRGWRWADKRVLELGCGLGLASCAAAWLGARAVATDGDADLLRVTARNIRHNTEAPGGGALTRHPVATARLLWGDPGQLSAALRLLGPGGDDVPSGAGDDDVSSGAGSPEGSHGHVDAILMSDVVYGSDPGLWEKLAATLAAAAGPDTLVLQAETRRIEGRLYHEYWALVEAAGFERAPLPPEARARIESDLAGCSPASAWPPGGAEVGLWALARRG